MSVLYLWQRPEVFRSLMQDWRGGRGLYISLFHIPLRPPQLCLYGSSHQHTLLKTWQTSARWNFWHHVVITWKKLLHIHVRGKYLKMPWPHNMHFDAEWEQGGQTCTRCISWRLFLVTRCIYYLSMFPGQSEQGSQLSSYYQQWMHIQVPNILIVNCGLVTCILREGSGQRTRCGIPGERGI